MKVKRMDFVTNGKTTFLVTKQGHELMLWDFKVWLEGYYDAYIPICNNLRVIGNLRKNPELLPKECEGYNGEPHFKKKLIWRPSFKIRLKRFLEHPSLNSFKEVIL